MRLTRKKTPSDQTPSPADIGNRIFELTHDFICVIGFDTYFRYVNSAFAETLGYTRAEMKATPFLEFVHPQDRVATREKFAAAIKGSDLDRFENRYRCKDGTHRWLQWSWSVAPSEKSIYAVGRDVTEAMEREAALRRAYRQQDLVLNSVADGVHGLDREGRITFVNPAAVKMHGWTLAELAGQHVHDKIHFQKADGSPFPLKNCPIQATLRDGVRRRVSDDLFWRKDGSSFPVDYFSVPLRNESGEVVGGVVTFRDMTERREAEAILRSCEEQYRGLFEVNPSPMWVYDPKTLEFLEVNEAAVRKYGYSREEFLRSNLGDIRPTEGVVRLLDFPGEKDRPAKYEGEVELFTKSGETVVAAIYTAPVNFNKRAARMTLAIDMTAREKNERKIRESERHLALAQRVAHIGSWQINLPIRKDGHNPMTWSDETFRIFGYEPDAIEPSQDTYFQMVYMDDLPRVKAAFLIAATEAEPFVLDYQMCRRDSRVRLVHAVSDIVRDEKTGQPSKMIGAVWDIMEARRA